MRERISGSACIFQISVQLSAANNELGRAHVILQHENHPARLRVPSRSW